MTLQIEDYALIGDRHSAALVGRDGSIDWLCLPRFDSPSCLSALVGTAGDGRWCIAPAGGGTPRGRRYRPGSLVLETELAASTATLRITDAMALRGEAGDLPRLVRLVEAVHGTVEVRSRLNPHFEYGTRTAWWREDGNRCWAVAGPAGLTVTGDVPHRVVDDGLEAVFTVSPGHPAALVLTWTGLQPPGPAPDAPTLVDQADAWWRDWSSRCSYEGPYRDAVVRALVTLKALTYAPSGGIVAAPTTSLPERIGGTRNWDYRYCWLRDATFTLLALFDGGYVEEAKAWREWLLRAVGGDPSRLQILYGIGGEKGSPEHTVPLRGYAASSPVRVGNAAGGQLQLDVYGEVLDSLHQAREHQLAVETDAWDVQRSILDVLESRWQEPDHGIWEVRGDPQHFVHSKVIAWTGVDRMIAGHKRRGLPGPALQWKALRRGIHDEVCEQGFDTRRGTFTQAYGSRTLDAAVLLIPAVGFLPPRDPRVLGTIAAVENDLTRRGLLLRYDPGGVDDGVGGGEGAFLACTFWLADAHALAGRPGQATAIYERLLGLRNDVGLLSEEYDPDQQRLVGNFPQALSLVPIVNTAHLLARGGRAGHRSAARSRSRT